MAERVLVVDDDEAIRNALAEYLQTLNYEVVTASDGEDALNKYHKGDFQLILADLMMPNMDGIQLLKRVREIDEDVLFLMITGHPSIGTAVESINRGADDYITKPFHLEEVKHRLNKAIEKRSLKGRLKTAHGLAWGLMLSIPLWLLLGIILVILIKG